MRSTKIPASETEQKLKRTDTETGEAESRGCCKMLSERNEVGDCNCRYGSVIEGLKSDLRYSHGFSLKRVPKIDMGANRSAEGKDWERSGGVKGGSIMVGQFIYSPINGMVPYIWVIKTEQMKMSMLWLLYEREHFCNSNDYIKAEAELSHRSFTSTVGTILKTYEEKLT